MERRREGLVAELSASGALGPGWAEAFRAMPRDAFTPDVIWFDRGEDGRLLPCDRRQEPELWADRVFSRGGVTIQVDDGISPAPASGRLATSGLSESELVARMLSELDVRSGLRCLEIGAGSGWNAALLTARLGERNVVTIEVDAGVADLARASLRRAGVAPLLITGDGQAGYPPSAPFDRVVATCGVRHVPYAWVEQTKPGGLVLFPLMSGWQPGGYLVRMRVGSDGVGIGRFGPGVDFMTLRAQRERCLADSELRSSQHEVAESVTDLDPCLLGEQRVLFLLMPALTPGVVASYDERTQQLRLGAWEEPPGQGSFAVVHDRHDSADFRVTQSGPRRLWDETVNAWRWWNEAGRPGADRFGVTVASPTEQRIWLDAPDGQSWPLCGGGLVTAQ